MPFNRWTHYANKYEQQARERLEDARRLKAEGGRNVVLIPSRVRDARLSWKIARSYRIIAETSR